MIRHFLVDIACCKADWTMDQVLEEQLKKIADVVRGQRQGSSTVIGAAAWVGVDVGLRCWLRLGQVAMDWLSEQGVIRGQRGGLMSHTSRVWCPAQVHPLTE